VPKYKLAKLAELFEREVGSKGCLKSFFAFNTNTYISLHYHANIVTAIADSSDALATSVYLEGLADFSFLSW